MVNPMWILRWTHLSRHFFSKVKLHFGAVFCFYLCAPSS
jgi:hypothetical protein